MYQRESNLDEENNFTTEILKKKAMQKREDLLVEMNIFYQA